MNDMWKILFGWALGLIATPAASYMNTFIQKRNLKQSIISEVNNLVSSLALNLYLLDIKVTPEDDKNFKLIKRAVRLCPHKLVDGTVLAQFGKIDFDNYKKYALTRNRPNAYSLKKLYVPVIDSAITNAWILDGEFRKSLLLFRDCISKTNEEIGLSMKFFDMTFTESGNKNFSVVEDNLNSSYKNIRDQLSDILTLGIEMIEKHQVPQKKRA